MFVLFVCSFARLLLCLLQSRHTYFLYSKQNLIFAIETKPVKHAHACSVTVNATNVFDLPKACKSHLSMHNNKMPKMRQCTICPKCVNAQQQCRTNRHNNVHGTHFLLRIGSHWLEVRSTHGGAGPNAAQWKDAPDESASRKVARGRSSEGGELLIDVIIVWTTLFAPASPSTVMT